MYRVLSIIGSIIACQHYLGYFVTLRIHLDSLRSMPFTAFSSRVISVFEFRGLHIASLN